MQKNINGATFAKMVIAASKLLEVNRELIDSLNVFPVPDGDTGTNMSLTMQSAIKELRACKSNSLHDLADSISRGALKGARGNSGVITSQIFRGMCAILKDKQDFDTKFFAKALKNAIRQAIAVVDTGITYDIAKEAKIFEAKRLAEIEAKHAEEAKNE